MNITAKAAAVYLANTPSPAHLFPLFESNPDQVIAPASLTKLVTAYTALRVNPDVNHRIDVIGFDADIPGSTPDLRDGDQLTLWGALTMMLLPSSNSAAAAVARTYGALLLKREGKPALTHAQCVARFVEEMNVNAARMGMFNSVFMNAHGLGAKGQRTTARDVGRLMLGVSNDFAILDIWSKSHAVVTITGANARPHRVTSRLIPIREKEDGINGGKTGTLYPSIYHLAVCASMPNGNNVIAIVLGAGEAELRDIEMRIMLMRLRQSYAWPDMRPTLQMS